jgi:hypothetical protein
MKQLKIELANLRTYENRVRAYLSAKNLDLTACHQPWKV